MENFMEEAKYSIFSISNWLIEHNAKVKGAFPMTVMRLMKLAYFAQAWSLALRDKPLFYDKIEAWKYGPVISTLYDSYKIYGKEGIPETSTINIENKLESEDAEFLEKVYNRYSDIDTYTLSRLTHVRQGPWFTTINDKLSRVILPSTIKEYYKELASKK